MPNRPNPDGWKGGSEDFEFVRTLEGHRTKSTITPDEFRRTSDLDYQRNARTFESADLGGDYDEGM